MNAKTTTFIFKVEDADESEALFAAHLDNDGVRFGYTNGPTVDVPADHPVIKAVLAIDATQSYADVEDAVCALFGKGN